MTHTPAKPIEMPRTCVHEPEPEGPAAQRGPQDPPARFELTPAEIAETVRFREAGRDVRVRHVFRPPAFSHWWDYERALQRTTEIVEEGVRFDRREEEASETLWDALCIRTEGYRLRDGSEAPRERVPLLHKIAGVRLLAQVFVDDQPPGDEPGAWFFDPDAVEIRLVAQRGGVIHDGLVHVLRRPTAREQKEHSRRMAGALFVHGSRTQKSLVPAKLKDLVALWDDLVQDVRGYAVAGQAADLAAARQHMDALHKQAAVQALFAPVE